MSIEVKDAITLDSLINIPLIKGEKGEKGDNGDKRRCQCITNRNCTKRGRSFCNN